MNYIVTDCFACPNNIENLLSDITSLSLEGDPMTLEMLEPYKFMDPENRVREKLLTIMETLPSVDCSHEESEKGQCVKCGTETCQHYWSYAGQKKNKDRIHNKGNGKGKYQAYKCEHCGKFKRRYLK